VIGDALLGLLPGLSDRLPQLQVSQGSASWDAVQSHGDTLVSGSGSLSFRSALPCLRVSDSAPIEPAYIAPAEPAGPAPTHLLRDGTASPLPENGLDLPGGGRIEHTDGQWQVRGDGLALNGEPLAGEQPVVAGDSLLADGTEFRLIEVLPA